MAWRGLHISNPARLHLANGQIRVVQDDGEVSFALEDIAWIIFDTAQASLTASLIASCMGARIPLIFSDNRHMPCGVALSYHQHHAQTESTFLQLDMSAAFKKRAWERLVKAKIENQAENLRLLQCRDAKALLAMARQVKSGDPDNIEARAARYYWSRLFDGFLRGDDSDNRNGMLNYGYAIIRAVISRALCASGFTLAIGLHHVSRRNPFNLADDLIEPFRPIVDWAVIELLRGKDKATGLTLDDRRALAGLLGRDIMICNEQMSVLHAAERMADSLVRAMQAKKPALIEAPHAW